MLQESITTAAKPGSNIISNWFTLSQRLLWRIGKGTKKCHCNSETHSELTQLSQFKNTKVFLTSLEVLASDDLIFCFNGTGVSLQSMEILLTQTFTFARYITSVSQMFFKIVVS